MARRSKDDAEVTKGNIIKAAIRLFMRDGVSHTTLEKIAAEAGCTRGAVYHHFENKSALLLELMKIARPPAEEVFEGVRELSEQRPLDALQSGMKTALGRMLSDTDSRDIHTIFLQNCEFTEKSNPMFDSELEHACKGHQLVKNCMLRAQEMGQMRTDISAEEAASIAAAMCIGIIHSNLRNPRMGFEPIGCDNAIDIFFKRFRKDDQGTSK